MKTVILLFQCRDQKGIVAKISDYIFNHDGNIITADQYSTDPENGYFFFRVEFYIDEAKHNKESLVNDLEPIKKAFSAEGDIHYKQDKLRMGIFVSEPDHCLVDLLYLWRAGELNVEIPFIVSNCREHENTARQYEVPFHYIPASTKDRKEKELIDIAKEKSDFLVFARYMLIVSSYFLNSYGKDIINIHHSFLPSFKGGAPYKQAFDKGVKVIGATAHFVTESLDEGPIISQVVEPVSHKDDIEDLMRKGKNMEKRALSNAVLNYIDYRIFKHQNKTIVF